MLQHFGHYLHYTQAFARCPSDKQSAGRVVSVSQCQHHHRFLAEVRRGQNVSGRLTCFQALEPVRQNQQLPRLGPRGKAGQCVGLQMAALFGQLRQDLRGKGGLQGCPAADGQALEALQKPRLGPRQRASRRQIAELHIDGLYVPQRRQQKRDGFV